MEVHTAGPGQGMQLILHNVRYLAGTFILIAVLTMNVAFQCGEPRKEQRSSSTCLAGASSTQDLTEGDQRHMFPECSECRNM